MVLAEEICQNDSAEVLEKLASFDQEARNSEGDMCVFTDAFEQLDDTYPCIDHHFHAHFVA